MNTEEANERRLAREVETCLGVLRHPDAVQGKDACARVEVTYQYDGDVEHCGHYIVCVPSIEPTGDETVDMQNHPATLAEDVVREQSKYAADEAIDYFSIDEVYAA